MHTPLSIKEVENGNALPLMEAFYSIQGEGYHSGKPAYFLRLGGCDVGCHWCDVKESWDPRLHPLINVSDIVSNIDRNKLDTIVITGGEPLMWDMGILTTSLSYKGFKIHLETSGTFPITGKYDWICLSPKKNQNSLNEIELLADELKIIIHNKSDLIWAEEQRKKVKDSCKLYLQPEWSRSKIVIPLITDYVMKNKYWQVSLQIHKYMNIP